MISPRACTLLKCLYFSLRASNYSFRTFVSLFSFFRAFNFTGNTTKPTCRFFFPETCCSTALGARWELTFKASPTIYVRFLTEFCSHQLHFCRVLHCLTAYGFNKCRTSLSPAPKYKMNAVKIEERSGIHIE